MSLIDSLTAPRSAPATQRRGIEEWIDLLVGAGVAPAGQVVTEHTALRQATVYACVSLLSETFASLPLKVYRDVNGRREEAEDDPLYALLHDQPNPLMNSFQWRQTLEGHRKLWGNAYAYLERGARGRIVALWPARPDRSKGKLDPKSRTLVYDLDVMGEKMTDVPASSVLHVPGLGFDGLTGYSPIGLMRKAVSMALAAEDFGAQFFGNSAMPSGVLSTQNQLSPEAAERLKQSWQTMHGGDNKWRVAVLEEGMTWASIGINPDEAQFIESRNLQSRDIARAFGVYPWMVGLDSQGMTYANVEQQQIAFMMWRVRPDATAWEHAIQARVAPARTTRSCFLLDGVVRADLKTRTDAYSKSVGRPYMTVNEARKLENLPPVEGGDELAQQPGAAAGGAAPAAEPPDDPSPGEMETPAEEASPEDTSGADA